MVGPVVLIALIGAIVVGLYLWVSVTTGSAVAEAKGFLSRLNEGSDNQAYESASSKFRAEQDLDSFTSVASGLGLDSYDFNLWIDRIVNTRVGDRVVLRGDLETEDGRSFPYSIQVIEEDGAWKVLSFLDSAREPIGAGAWFKQAPGEDELQEITRQTMVAFASAVKAGDFADFYNASVFRSASLGQLQGAFQYLIDNKVDMSWIESVDAIYDGPAEFEMLRRGRISDTIVVSGAYPNESAPVTFKLKYRYHHPVWKLFAVNVDVAGVSR